MSKIVDRSKFVNKRQRLLRVFNAPLQVSLFAAQQLPWKLARAIMTTFVQTPAIGTQVNIIMYDD